MVLILPTVLRILKLLVFILLPDSCESGLLIGSHRERAKLRFLVDVGYVFDFIQTVQLDLKTEVLQVLLWRLEALYLSIEALLPVEHFFPVSLIQSLLVIRVLESFLSDLLDTPQSLVLKLFLLQPFVH